MQTIAGEDLAVRLNLDYALTLTSKVGVWGGLDQRHLRAQIPKMNAVYASINALGDQRLPYGRPLGDALSAALDAWVEARRAEALRVVVLGEPGAVSAARMLSSLAPDPGAITWVDGMDGLEAALGGAPAHLVVLDGPPWVRWLAESLGGRAKGATVVGGELPIAGLEGAETLPGPADAALGVLGPFALAAAALCGAAIAPIVEEAIRARQRCASMALFENPALLFAAVLVAAREHGVERLVFLLPSGRLEPWAAWATRAWSSITTRGAARANVRVPAGVPSIAVRLGDEAMIQHLLGGPHDLLGCALVLDDDGAQDLEGRRRWGLARSLLTAQFMQLCRDGRPVVQLRVPTLDPAMIAGLSVVCLHAATATALASDIDPLLSPAVQLWRTLATEEITSLPPYSSSESSRG